MHNMSSQKLQSIDFANYEEQLYVSLNELICWNKIYIHVSDNSVASVNAQVNLLF